MSKKKKKKRANEARVIESTEADEIATLRAALAPLLKKGMGVHRLASACGAHPQDMRGFLDGTVSLTWAIRTRLTSQLPSLTAEASK